MPLLSGARTRLLVTAVVALVVCGGFFVGLMGPAIAQPQPNATPTGNATNTTPLSALQTNGSPRASGSATPVNTTPSNTSGGGGGGWLPSGPSLDVPSPPQMAADIVETGLNAVMDAITGLVDRFNWLVNALPAPGDPQEPSTWYPGFTTPLEGDGAQGPSADNGSSGPGPSLPFSMAGWWRATWGIYAGLAGIFGLPVFVSGIIAFSRSDLTARERGDRLREIGKALLLIVAGPLLLPLILHIGNLFAIGVSPSGAAFMTTPGNASKLGIGLALAVPLLVIESMVILVALFILFAQWLSVFFICVTWPIYAAAVASNSRYVQPLGTLGVTTLLILIGLKALQAIWLRFLFELPLDFTKTASLLTILAIIVGLAIGFIGLPIKGTEKALPQSIVSAGRETNKKTPDTEQVQSIIDRRSSNEDQ